MQVYDMNIVVCCPSYRRPANLDTPNYLPFIRVYVDGSEIDAYRQNNPNVDIVRCADGVQGNLCRVRNHILDKEFENGADVVLIVDDDLKEVARWEKGGNIKPKRIIVKAETFPQFVYKHSLMARDIGAYLWGINVNFDKAVYREYSPFSTNAYIGGPFQAHMRGSEIRYDEALPLKEDYDITLQHLNKYRIALRSNAYHYICKQAENPGVCATYRNMDRERQQFEALQRKWGEEIVQRDKKKMAHMGDAKAKGFDFNPIIKVPIKGV